MFSTSQQPTRSHLTPRLSSNQTRSTTPTTKLKTTPSTVAMVESEEDLRVLTTTREFTSRLTAMDLERTLSPLSTSTLTTHLLPVLLNMLSQSHGNAMRLQLTTERSRELRESRRLVMMTHLSTQPTPPRATSTKSQSTKATKSPRPASTTQSTSTTKPHTTTSTSTMSSHRRRFFQPTTRPHM